MTARIAVVTAACALLLAVLAIQAAHSHPAAPYPLTCGQDFRNGQTGVQAPVYYPCSSTPPAP